MAHATKAAPPPLEDALAPRRAAWWRRLHADLDTTYGPLTEKWSYYAKADRWSLQLKRQKGQRTILYMVLAPPRQFLVALVLGEKAVSAARAVPLPPDLLHAIDLAPVYPEGRLVWFEITRAAQLAQIRALAAVKMDDKRTTKATKAK